MIPEPLHPAIVHFPIVLVVLLPIAASIALWVIARGETARRAWLPVLGLAALLALSSWAAVQTGGREEDTVEAVVAESAIHEHEEAAELFLPLAVGTLLLLGVGLVQGRPGQAARYLGTVAAFLLIGAGYRVGHTGGELVYEHGAAQAYQTGTPSVDRDEDDHERRERRDRSRP